MAQSLFLGGNPQFFDANGDVLAGGLVYFYEVGTSTAKDSYPTRDDADNQTNANANPVVLDSAGRAAIWLRGQYKVILKDSAAATIWTVDEVGDADDTNTLPKDYLAGLVLSLDTDTDHDINITAGEARDDADSEDLVLASEITKRVDAAWAVGDDQGGMDTGSVANSTTYYVWLIKRVDTGVVDALFSTSSTAPTMPTNYTKKRLIGHGKTDGSANWVFIRAANQPVLLTTTGNVTNYKPSRFLAFAQAQANATGDGTALNPVPFATEVTDRTGDYATTGTFTASVTAPHDFSGALTLADVSNGVTHTRVLIEIITSNRTYTLVDVNPDSIDVSNALTLPFCVIGADMDEGDTAQVRFLVSGATQIVDITTASYFSGRAAI